LELLKLVFIIAYYCNYLYGWHFNNYNNIHNYNNFQAAPPTFCDPCLAACAWSVTSGTSLCMHYLYCTKKYAQMQCRRASILADTSPARAWSTWLAPARFHNRSFPEPHTRQAPSQTPPLLEEPTRIGAGTSERVGMCLKHGALAGSHGTHWRDHMEPMSHNRRSNCLPLFITYHGTIPMPTSWQTTSGIHRRNPACGRQAPRKSGCAGGVGLSRCRLLVQPAVYQGYIQLVWRIKSASCGRAHIRFENQSNPTNLNNPNKCNKYINYNKDNK
jgi:hypothetical protein